MSWFIYRSDNLDMEIPYATSVVIERALEQMRAGEKNTEVLFDLTTPEGVVFLWRDKRTPNVMVAYVYRLDK